MFTTGKQATIKYVLLSSGRFVVPVRTVDRPIMSHKFGLTPWVDWAVQGEGKTKVRQE